MDMNGGKQRKKSGHLEAPRAKSYNTTTICFSLCHQENMHNRYLLDSTLRFPVEGRKQKKYWGRGKFSYGIAQWKLQQCSWRALEWNGLSIVARCTSPVRDEQAPGDGERPGSSACCNPWDLQRVRHDWAAEKQGIATLRIILAAGCLVDLLQVTWILYPGPVIVHPGYYYTSILISDWLCEVLQSYKDLWWEQMFY